MDEHGVDRTARTESDGLTTHGGAAEDIHIKDYAIASSINGMAIGDLDGVVTYVNKAALSIYGTDDPSDIIGKRATIFAKSEQEALGILETVLVKGEWSGEVSGWRKNGEAVTVLLSASLVKDDAGRPVCIVCSFIDITERKRMEEELRVKESAIASSINGIVIGDPSGTITYVNKAALDMWGAKDPSEIMGRHVTVFAESEQEAREILSIVLEKGSWSGEITGRTMSGAPITVHLTASLVKDEHGEPAHLMCSFIDVTEHKRIENELRIKECAIASSLNGIGIGDLEGNILYVNEAALKMWGADDPSEVVGRSALEFAESQEEAIRVFSEFMEKGGWSGEISGRRKDGSLITVHLTASLVKNERGEPICTMDSFLDITERKRMEEELRIKDLAIASSIDGIGITDLEGNVIYVNEAALRMWGAEDPSEVIGRSAFSFARSQEEAMEIYRSVLENGSWSGEVSGYRKDGSPITVHLSVSLVKNEKGEPVCGMDSFVDITDRKRMEEELRIKDFAIASSIDGIGITDLEGIVTYVNEAALRMLGASDPGEVVGSSIMSLVSSKDEAQAVITAVLEHGSFSGEVSGSRKDGSPVTVHLSASLVRNDKGEPVCMMYSFVDITERKRMEEELRIKDFAIASSINGIGISDLEGNIIYVNEAALRMWGAEDPSEVIGTSVLSLAQSQEEALTIYRLVLEEGSWSGEVSGYRKDGSPVTVHLSASLVRNDKGEPVCMMDSFVDITDRKRMEEELRIKDFAIASSINGIVIGDLTGTITYVNSAFLDLWGGNDPSEVIGRSIISFAENESDAERILKSVIEEGTWTGEVTARKKSGRLIVVQLAANMVKNDDGTPICLMASFVDITERIVAEQKLQKAYEGLEQRVAERTEELVRANIRLKREIEERRQAEQSLLQKEEELRMKSLNLEEANTALKVLLKRGEQDKQELEDKVLANIKELVLPYVEKLKMGNLDEKQKTYVEILESNLNDIISPFLKKLSSHYLNLTPTEIQVADLIKDGKSTKQIAEVLGISERAVEFHRNNIRDKLGLKNSKTNLRSYLMTLG